MPSSHRRYGEWTPAKIRSEATRIGPMLRLLVDRKRAFYCTGCARGWPRRRVTPGPSGIIGTA
jgi:hypothetical protein